MRGKLGIAAAAATALTLAVNLAPASAATSSPLGQIMKDLNPKLYWVLDDAAAPGTDQSGNGGTPLTPTGSGRAVTFGALSHPFGGSPTTVRMTPDAVHSGQYLRSARTPIPSQYGSIVLWFRLGKLPGWRQVLAVDNGAYSGVPGGLLIGRDGRLLSADVTGFVDFRSAVSVADGQWHCVVWTDGYNAGPPQQGSSLYLDGDLLTDRLFALFESLLGQPGARLLVGDGGPSEASSIGRLRGYVSNIALYADPLTAANVESIWNNGSGNNP